MSTVRSLFGEQLGQRFTRPSASLLKWVGNKFRMAEQITSYLPERFGTVYDVFLGGGSFLATIAPSAGVGSDSFTPLIEIWTALKANPQKVKRWYEDRHNAHMAARDRRAAYERVKASYNRNPNGADLLFLCRTCYAGVVRFRQADGYMSTPIGPHKPIPPAAFAKRVDEWHSRVTHCQFMQADFADVMSQALPGDVVYCDPPYTHSQAILYGAQSFELRRLCKAIEDCKRRGVYVLLSIDGTKKSGAQNCHLWLPRGLFEREVFIHVGRSMLRRLQMTGETLEGEVVADRLLLTY
jgi:DNA adenine methylase